MANADRVDITLLFTDIESSTALWERFPESMPAVVAAHDALLRECVETQGGNVFKWVGDGICATMPDPIAAAAAAREIQERLSDSRWWLSDAHHLKARIAFHACECQRRGDDYFGLPVSQVARILAAGHGGQILLSEPAESLLRDSAPARDDIADLGRHQLRSLSEPVRIFQLGYRGCPPAFPPLRTGGNFPSNLPLSLTRFVGRTSEVGRLRALLTEKRLITITGPGGCGKSRLAVHVAESVIDRFPGGVFLVELAGVREGELVTGAVASVLGVREEAEVSLTESLFAGFRDKKCLVILDNCEHLIGACASFVDALLQACPDIQVLSTGTETLRVPGESVMRLPVMRTPGDHDDDVDQLLGFESVQLLLDRVQSVNGSFRLSSTNAASVAQVCRRLDGIPLALELAAARASSLSIDQIAARMDSGRFRLLSRGNRTASDRQRTLGAVIDWSYDLLTEDERRLLCDLSVFAGGWTLEAAEEVCGAGADFDVLDTLSRLVERSLVQFDTGSESARYGLLESIRLYGIERLRESSQQGNGLQHRHSRFYEGLCVRAGAGMQGDNPAIWFAAISTDMANLRAAVEFGLEHDVASVLRLATAVHYYASARGCQTECRSWLERAIARADEVEERILVGKAHAAVGNLEFSLSSWSSALARYKCALEIGQAWGDKRFATGCLCNIALTNMSRGSLEDVSATLDEALVAYQEGRDPYNEARVRTYQAVYWVGKGEFGQAADALRTSLGLYQATGSQSALASVHHTLGGVLLRQGAYIEAQRHLLTGLKIMCGLEDVSAVTGMLAELAWVYAETGEEGLALDCLGYTRQLIEELGLGDSSYPAQDIQNALRSLTKAGLRTHSEGQMHGGRAAAIEFALALSTRHLPTA